MLVGKPVWFGKSCFKRRVVSEDVLAETKSQEVGGEQDYYLTLHCHQHNDSWMSRDGSSFNVSLTVRDEVTRECPESIVEAESNRSPAFQSKARS